jgi:hypothetical protein
MVIESISEDEFQKIVKKGQKILRENRSEDFFRSCCENEKRYIAHFEHGLPILFCELHFAKKSLLFGVEKIYNLKTKKEIKHSHSKHA